MKLDRNKFEIALANSGMMLKDLYTKANVSDKALLDMRQGKSNPRPSTLGRIAKALNVDVQDIIQEGE